MAAWPCQCPQEYSILLYSHMSCRLLRITSACRVYCMYVYSVCVLLNVIKDEDVHVGVRAGMWSEEERPRNLKVWRIEYIYIYVRAAGRAYIMLARWIDI